VTRDRRLGWLLVLVGAGLALAVQVSSPVNAPLYDGVQVQEPYRFLHPTGDQVGSPTSFASQPNLADGLTPVFAAATSETPPQAQLVAQKDAFTLTPGATGMRVSITPIDPAAPAPEGRAIVGNVYRILVTDQSGTVLAPKPCEGCRSLIMRSPEGVAEATVMRLAGDTWVGVPTEHSVLGIYQSNVDAVGDFAVISGGAAPGGGVDLALILLGGGIVLIIVAFVGLIAVRQRPAPVVVRRAPGRIPGRLPAKRQGPRRPPQGRSDQ
jgi:hypothetical protein